MTTTTTTDGLGPIADDDNMLLVHYFYGSAITASTLPVPLRPPPPHVNSSA